MEYVFVWEGDLDDVFEAFNTPILRYIDDVSFLGVCRFPVLGDCRSGDIICCQELHCGCIFE